MRIASRRGLPEMRSAELRERFLKFFESKGHKVLPSASLIPKGDTTLLLTGAGMVPFKPYFLGKEKPQYTRITTCQKCIRTPDIDSVGKTARHGTFFEMLGNFSFGDYFKEEAIEWAWEFVTTVLGFKKEQLWVTIYLDDDEAFTIWNEKIGVPADRIVRLGKDSNFWEIGVGPCGPCSEIHVDRGPEFGCGRPDCGIECGCDRFLEIWNLVFIQFHKDENGEYHPLTKKGIDTGMGLERVAAVLQGVNSIFDTDQVRPLIEKISEISGIKYGDDKEHDVSIRVITDHIRSVTFMVGDGILPGNDGRGYVLRRILRRAVRHGRLLGIQGCFLTEISKKLIKIMGSVYPELKEREEYIYKVIRNEEERFNSRLDEGTGILEGLMNELKSKGGSTVDGKDVFRLYDTFGFPPELTEEIASENGLSVDMEGFARAMEEQRRRAREARQESSYLDGASEDYMKLFSDKESEFTGYDGLEGRSRVSLIIRDGERVEFLSEGEEGDILLESTPFYGASGGQVGDRGIIRGESFAATVVDTVRPVENIYLHKVKVTEGVINLGDEAVALVDEETRRATARNHTATHLLHKALKELLGDHVNQAGSLVNEERLRFDFTHTEPLTGEQIERIENAVNRRVLENLEVKTLISDLDKAKEMGAVALFDEKYKDKVRVVCIGDYSMELCGGTHVKRTGDIGLFKIVSESSIASGVRRIEAVTGFRSLEYLREQDAKVDAVASVLKSSPADIVNRVEKLAAMVKDLEKQLEEMRREVAEKSAGSLLDKAETVEGVKILVAAVENTDMDSMRSMGDQLRDRLGSGVIVLGTVSDGKPLFVAMATKDVVKKGVHCGDVVKAAAAAVGGGGGGRPDMAQAGGKDPSRLEEALAAARNVLLGQITK